MVTNLKTPVVSAALICAVLVYFGAVRVQNRAPFISLLPPKNIVRLDGALASNPSKTALGTYRADFLVTHAYAKNGAHADARGMVTVVFPAETVEALYPGKRYTAAHGGILAETGARLTLSVTPGFAAGEYAVTAAQAAGWGSGVAGRLRRFRALCRLQFRRLLYTWGNAGGLLLALLSGSREYTERTVSDAFKNAGLSHILALSGMHLSLVGGLALVLGKRAAGKKAAAAVQLAAIVLFVWFAGLSPSLFRALVCVLIPLAASALRLRRPDALSVLCASFLVHLMVFPAHVQEAAFLLSYGALAGILLLGESIRRLCCARLFPAVSDALSESAAAQVVTAPITLRLFGCLTPVGIIASVVVSPLVTYFLYAGLVGIVICLALPFLSPVFGGILNVLYGLIRGIVVFFARFPAVTI